MLAWFTKLIHIRRGSSSLNDGDRGHMKIVFDAEKKWLVMDRAQVRVITNLGSLEADFEVPAEYRLIAQSNAEIVLNDGRVALPPDSLAILSGEED
jgi:maltooligosyltrehalose trehalohydrolase